MGLRAPETERLHEEFHAGRDEAELAVETLSTKLRRQARLNRALDLGRVPEITSRILRRFHRENLLGGTLVVAGTNAIYAYEAAAGVHVASDLLATADLDILLDARAKLKFSHDGRQPGRVIDILASVDRTFRSVSNRHRAVNNNGFMVELIKPEPRPPWRAEREGLGEGDMAAAMIANMRWIESAPKFDTVAIGTDGAPVPMTAPDPRAFSVYKLNMGTRDPTRDPLKRKRDVQQAEIVASIVRDYLPQLPFSDDQLKNFPKEIVDHARTRLDPFFS